MLQKIIHINPSTHTGQLAPVTGDVVVVIDDVEYVIPHIYGETKSDPEALVRMNVHFWMGRNGHEDYYDNGEGGESMSSLHCPYEVRIT